MRTTQGEKIVLYHAVSSYQLLEAILHRLRCHPGERAALVLPDFITEKYPQYGKLRERGFFQEVSLFPYLRLPHQSRDQVYRDALRFCRETLPRPLSRYEKIYVAGAHFYFSLALLQEEIPFTMLEDAAGMLARGRELYENLAQRYPLHGEIAWEAGLFTGENPLIREVICLKEAQGGTVPSKCRDFSVEIALERLDPKTRKAVVRLFVPWPLWSRAEGILLTQHLAQLGRGTWEGQRQVYRQLAQGPLRGVRLLVKPHPDDRMDYREIFPRCRVLRRPFPAELLPYVLKKGPRVVYTWDSTSCQNLKRHYTIVTLGRDRCGT